MKISLVKRGVDERIVDRYLIADVVAGEDGLVLETVRFITIILKFMTAMIETETLSQY